MSSIFITTPKKVLVVKNISIEGPGFIKTYLDNNGFDSRIVEASESDILPKSLDDFSAIVVLGGPMNVYEGSKYPFLDQEHALLTEALQRRIPTLGICLGAQLLARAAGADVVPSLQEEVGWYNVALTKEGKAAPFFANTPEKFHVFQWHSDSFNLPPKASLLAASTRCPNQAFAIDDFAFGFQFHFEVNKENIDIWVENYIKDPIRSAAMKEIFGEEFDSYKEAMAKLCNSICTDFFGRICS